MIKCTGDEKHEHYVFATSIMMSHSHRHSVQDKDFNRLHHHSPLEHDNFSEEELEKDATFTEVPW